MAGNTAGSLASTNLGDNDAWLAKYNTEGIQQWIIQIGTSSSESIGELATDTDGNLYAGGYTGGSLGGINASAGSNDAWLAKFDTDGNQQWIVQTGTSSADSVSGLGTDDAGNLFVAGTTSGSLASTNLGDDDAWLAKYRASDGYQYWQVQFGTGEADSSTSLAMDVDGGVYVAGSTYGSFGAVSAGNYDAWLVYYSNPAPTAVPTPLPTPVPSPAPEAAYTQAWVTQLGSSYGDYAYAVAACAATGDVFVGGYTDGGSLNGTNAGGEDVWFSKYDSSGTMAWTKQFGTSSDDRLHAMTCDSTGNLFVGGRTAGSLGGAHAGGTFDVWFAKFSSAGDQQWISQLGTSASEEIIQAIDCTSDGSVFIGGTTQGSLGGSNAGSNDFFVAKYDSDGAQLFIVQEGTSSHDSVHAMATDIDGNVFVAALTTGSLGGNNAGSGDIFIAKYSSAGVQQWSIQIGTSSDDYPLSMTTDGDGSVFLGGFTNGGSLGGTNAGSYDIWLAKYDTDGNQQWIVQTGTDSSDILRGMGTDDAGNLFVAGFTEGSLASANLGGDDAWLAKYRSSDGYQYWQVQFGTGFEDEVWGLAMDGNGGVYVAGYTAGSFGAVNAGSYDAWLAYYPGPAPTAVPTPAPTALP